MGVGPFLAMFSQVFNPVCVEMLAGQRVERIRNTEQSPARLWVIDKQPIVPSSQELSSHRGWCKSR